SSSRSTVTQLARLPRATSAARAAGTAERPRTRARGSRPGSAQNPGVRSTRYPKDAVVSSRTLPRPAKLPVVAALGGALAVAALAACVEPPQRGDGNQAQRTETRTTPAAKRTATIPADGWNERIAWRGL